MNDVVQFLLMFVTWPDSLRGRRLRIVELMKRTGANRDTCAAIIYARDIGLGRQLSAEERADADRIKQKIGGR